MRTRVAIGALGVLVGLYGGWLVLSRGHDLLNLGLWLAGGVVLHDGVLALVVLAVGTVAVRLLPRAGQGPGRRRVRGARLGDAAGRAGARAVRRPVRQPHAAGSRLHGRLAGAGRAGPGRRGHGLARRLATEVTVARVLVVDDDPTVREVVVSYLRAADHEVVEAADGETALERHRDAPARPRRPRPDAARHRRDRGLPAAARGRGRPGDHADRARRGDRPRHRARGRRRRLRHQAVQPARAGAARRLGAASGRRAHRAPAAGRRRPRRRRGRPRGVPRRTSRSRSPAASSTCCASCWPTRGGRSPATSCSSRCGGGRSATSRR